MFSFTRPHVYYFCGTEKETFGRILAYRNCICQSAKRTNILYMHHESIPYVRFFLKPYYSFLMMNRLKAIQHTIQKNQLYGHFIVHFWSLTYTILPKVLAPLLMKGLSTLVICMSTNLNV